MEEKEKCCLTCMHAALPQRIDPCNKCIGHDEWKPKDAVDGDTVFRGIDPGAPEGDKTNVRRPWPLDGREINENLFKDGPLVETARAYMKQLTRLDYAIEGVRSKISSIGLKFTDKNLSRDEIDLLVGQLNALQLDLFELEEERERKLRGAADVEIKDRDS